MKTLNAIERETWRLREHADVLCTLFPNAQFPVMQDHVDWISMEPISAGASAVRTAAPAPVSGSEAEDRDHGRWKRNHQFTTATLDEDFVIGESVQESAGAGANADMLSGRFAGALGRFNDVAERMLADA